MREEPKPELQQVCGQLVRKWMEALKNILAIFRKSSSGGCGRELKKQQGLEVFLCTLEKTTHQIPLIYARILKHEVKRGEECINRQQRRMVSPSPPPLPPKQPNLAKICDLHNNRFKRWELMQVEERDRIRCLSRSPTPPLRPPKPRVVSKSTPTPQTPCKNLEIAEKTTSQQPESRMDSVINSRIQATTHKAEDNNVTPIPQRPSVKDRELRKTSPKGRQQNHELKPSKNEKISTHSESSQKDTKASSTDSTSSEQTSQSGQIMEGSAKPSCSSRLLGDEEIQDISNSCSDSSFEPYSSASTSLLVSHSSSSTLCDSSNMNCDLYQLLDMNSSGQPSNSNSLPMNSSGQPFNSCGKLLNRSIQTLQNSVELLNRSGQPLNSSCQALNSRGPPLNSSGQSLNTSGKLLNSSSQPLNCSSQPLNSSDQPSNSCGLPLNSSGKLVNSSSQPLNITGENQSNNIYTEVNKALNFNGNTNCNSNKKVDDVNPRKIIKTGNYSLQRSHQIKPIFRKTMSMDDTLKADYLENWDLLNCISSTKQVVKQGKEQHKLQKKELILSIWRRVDHWRSRKLQIDRETQANEELGREIETKLQDVAKSVESRKFVNFVEDLDRITRLLLILSGGLARLENNLYQCVEMDTSVISRRREKILNQIEDARKLEMVVERRAEEVWEIVNRHLSIQDTNQYRMFLSAKTRLIVEGRETEERVRLALQQIYIIQGVISYRIPH